MSGVFFHRPHELKIHCPFKRIKFGTTNYVIHKLYALLIATILTRLYLFIVLIITFLQSCGPNPKARSNAFDNSKLNIDSAKYIPKPIGWTNDFVHLFSPSEKQSLDSLISKYEKETTVELSVATVDSAMIGPIDFEAYTLLMARTWGVGKKEKNNGILIVIAPALRRIRIQNGYGIEKVLTNDETNTIIDSTFIPLFKQSEYYQGTREGIIAIMNTLKKNGL